MKAKLIRTKSYTKLTRISSKRKRSVITKMPLWLFEPAALLLAMQTVYLYMDFSGKISTLLYPQASK